MRKRCRRSRWWGAAESNGGFREERRATASEPELRFEFGKFRKRAPFT